MGQNGLRLLGTITRPADIAKRVSRDPTGIKLTNNAERRTLCVSRPTWNQCDRSNLHRLICNLTQLCALVLAATWPPVFSCQ